MNRNDAFSRCHPLVNFLYFALVLLGAMLLQHPVCQAISLIGAIACFCTLGGEKPGGFRLWYALVLFAVTAAVNPAFSHEGRTILRYLPSGNPLTLESILYGIGAGLTLCTALVWFSCYTRIMTSDKFVYLFGRIVPALSLVLSMTLRFVPRFSAQARRVSKAQAAVGNDHAYGKSAAPHQMRADGLFDSRDMVSGERSRHGGLHARPGLRTSRQKRVFDLYAHEARQTAARGVIPPGRNRCGRLCRRRAFPGAIIPAAGAQV